MCIFKWEEENTENCIFIDNVYPWNCPGEMKRIDDKCIIRISSFDSSKHTGENKSGKCDEIIALGQIITNLVETWVQLD